MRKEQSKTRLINNIKWLGDAHPIVIAGPCSAETEDQVMTVAKQLKTLGIKWFRSGIWKPRTRPGAFEGVGEKGLPWLQRVQNELGLKVTIEIAKAEHIEAALSYGIENLWIGARTSTNPFAVQEIADYITTLKKKPAVLIKNPVNPDLNLWLGAVERIEKAGVKQIACIHRGFSYYGESKFRNPPHWQIPIELRRLRPDLPLICDPSHISGKRELIENIAQMSMDLCFDGLMIEVHPTPDDAWSDSVQQITASRLKEILSNLIIRRNIDEDETGIQKLEEFRNAIDEIDSNIVNSLIERMQISKEIAEYKKVNELSVLQPQRWEEILQQVLEISELKGMSSEFVENIFKAIHLESIRTQNKLMNE